MTEFAYLSVLLAIILGLAITQILQGWRGRMIYQARIEGYWLTTLWSLVTLLISTQAWWAMFDLRDRHEWTFGQFAVLLAQTIFIYLASALIYPDFGVHETVDLRAHYFRQAPYFFGAMATVVLLSILRNFLLNHTLPGAADLGFHVFFLVTSLTAAAVAREWYHKLASLLVAGVFLAYVVILFARLR